MRGGERERETVFFSLTRQNYLSVQQLTTKFTQFSEEVGGFCVLAVAVDRERVDNRWFKFATAIPQCTRHTVFPPEYFTLE